MSRRSVQSLAPGVVLTRPVLDGNGRTVIAAGAPLAAREIEILQRSSLTEVDVLELPPDLPPSAGRVALELQRYYRNAGMDHPAVQRLFEITLRRRVARTTTSTSTGRGGTRAP